MDKHKWRRLTAAWAAALAEAGIDSPGSFERERRARLELRNALDRECYDVWLLRKRKGA